MDRQAILQLADGSEYRGYSFGYEQSVSGEMVFTTAMTGYPESLTDPSYRGQLLVPTYPMIGNYGVPDDERDTYGLPEHFESERIQCTALIIGDYSAGYSHWDSHRSLGSWLMEQHIPGIYGIDTRSLAKRLRTYGAMSGRIIFEGDDIIPFRDPNVENLVAQVSTDRIESYGKGRYRVLMIDCGIKYNILRCLLRRDVTIRRVPWDYDFTTDDDYDGIFISNGPGDPSRLAPTISHLRTALAGDRPIMGICLGHQLLALAAGARTYKMKYGHRGHNQTVRIPGTHRCFVTSQNHGFAVDGNTLPDDWECLFENLNDGTVEGLRHKTKPFFSTQFHPEASSGPVDTDSLFDQFITNIKNHVR